MTKTRIQKLSVGITAMLLLTTSTILAQDSRSLRDYLGQSQYRNQNTQQRGPACDNGSCSFSSYGPQLDRGMNDAVQFLSHSRDLATDSNSRARQSLEDLRSRFHGPDSGYTGNYQSQRINSDFRDGYRDFDRREPSPRRRNDDYQYESRRVPTPRYDSLDRRPLNDLNSLSRRYQDSGDYPSRGFESLGNRFQDWNRDLSRTVPARNQRPFDERNFDSREYPQQRQQRNYGPRLQYEDLPAPGSLPAPQRGLNSTTDTLTKVRNSLTRRYSDPSVQRFLRTMTPNKSLQLHSEISTMIDQRHYQPVSYDTRMNRVLQHLNEAMSNDAFLNSNRISQVRAEAFRDELRRYSGRVNSLTQMQSAMRGLMNSAQQTLGLNPSVIAYEFIVASIEPLDKYSAFEPEDPGSLSDAELETDVKVAALDETVVGIGVQIKQDERGLLVDGTLKNGPAAEAGIQKGDIIVSINGRDIGGMPMGASADMISGREGTPVMLEIRRGQSTRSMSLRRRRVRILAVNDARIVDQNRGIAYLKLDKFNSTSSEEIDQALWSLHRKGMKSLVFDLRGNPGGLLNECVDICNKFVPCGTIVSTRGRLASDNSVEQATYSQTWKVPIVVLVDGNSASASEIFAAAIQDNERGIVVGEKSYGKGTVQTHFPLSAVKGKLRLTTARFYSPDGRAMAGAGVTPDVRVAGRQSQSDDTLQRAVTIARSQEVFDLAEASRRCRVRNRAEKTDSMMGPIAKAE